MLQIIEGAFFLARPDADGGKDAVTRRADTGIGIEAGENLLDRQLLRRGRRRGGTVWG
ncbi:hypothetical protein [Streptomyces sp. SAS_276]|uniref:hypothetical protein n=1 Tax=Streptomyces sp. SAS_276 TaxID=3412745 RepID=UPI00403C503E